MLESNIQVHVLQGLRLTEGAVVEYALLRLHDAYVLVQADAHGLASGSLALLVAAALEVGADVCL